MGAERRDEGSRLCRAQLAVRIPQANSNRHSPHERGCGGSGVGARGERGVGARGGRLGLTVLHAL
jgi:hypothetical protein